VFRSDPAPRTEAVDLVRQSVSTDDRVLVTGASGWLGRTQLSLLWHAHGPDWIAGHVLATASRSRIIAVSGAGSVEVHRATMGHVDAFRPTLIVNCSFPTRDKVAALGTGTYLRVTEELTQNLLTWMALPSVERVITFSSGAAVPSAKFPDDATCNPYGFMKAREEEQVLDAAARLGRNVVVCRVWSVSGPHVQAPRNYAFSDFIMQAMQAGEIRIGSTVPVIRTYASVDDVLAVAVATVGRQTKAFNSGGVTVELGDLAARIANFVGGTTVRRADRDPEGAADRYGATDDAFAELCDSLRHSPATLDEQIEAAAAGVTAWN
jgi:nucleoside-diphosphate-sugar epimerase